MRIIPLETLARMPFNEVYDYMTQLTDLEIMLQWRYCAPRTNRLEFVRANAKALNNPSFLLTYKRGNSYDWLADYIDFGTVLNHTRYDASKLIREGNNPEFKVFDPQNPARAFTAEEILSLEYVLKTSAMKTGHFRNKSTQKFIDYWTTLFNRNRANPMYMVLRRMALHMDSPQIKEELYNMGINYNFVR
jgi:hypothetical protein